MTKFKGLALACVAVVGLGMAAQTATAAAPQARTRAVEAQPAPEMPRGRMGVDVAPEARLAPQAIVFSTYCYIWPNQTPAYVGRTATLQIWDNYNTRWMWGASRAVVRSNGCVVFATATGYQFRTLIWNGYRWLPQPAFWGRQGYIGTALAY